MVGMSPYGSPSMQGMQGMAAMSPLNWHASPGGPVPPPWAGQPPPMLDMGAGAGVGDGGHEGGAGWGSGGGFGEEVKMAGSAQRPPHAPSNRRRNSGTCPAGGSAGSTGSDNRFALPPLSGVGGDGNVGFSTPFSTPGGAAGDRDEGDSDVSGGGSSEGKGGRGRGRRRRSSGGGRGSGGAGRGQSGGGGGAGTTSCGSSSTTSPHTSPRVMMDRGQGERERERERQMGGVAGSDSVLLFAMDEDSVK
jgi:hypothetical protein